MKKNVLYLLILSCCYLIIGKLSFFIFDINELLNESFSDNFTLEQINYIFDFKKKIEWISYIISPMYLTFKIFIISNIIYIGLFFLNMKNISFKDVFNKILIAEFIFLLVPIFKILWFYFSQTNYTLQDLQYFYPLSALNIIGYQGLDVWFIYPLQTLNLFELAYWFLLAYYVGKIASPTKSIDEKKYPIDFGLKIVASSYGSALLLWVVVVMFFTLNYS